MEQEKVFDHLAENKKQYTSIPSVLNESAASVAVYVPNVDKPSLQISYPNLRQSIKRVASSLPFSTINPGDVITFLIPNSLEFVITFFAATSIRAIANPLNPSYSAEEILFYLEDVQPKFVIIPEGNSKIEKNVLDAIESFKKASHEIPVYVASFDATKIINETVAPGNAFHKVINIDPVLNFNLSSSSSVESAKLIQSSADIAKRGEPVPNDIALMLHTSGTTGRPKGVPLSHKNILRTMYNIHNTYELTPDDCAYLVMPLFHVHGLIGVLLSSLHAGASVIVAPAFSVSKFWTDLNNFAASWYSAVPTIHQMLLNRLENFKGEKGRLRFIRSCSSSLAPVTLTALESTFDVPVIEAYAMSEAAHQMTSNYLPPGKRKVGSVGKGRGVRVALFDPQTEKRIDEPEISGEVCVAGTNIILGYHNNEKATKESFYPSDEKSDGFPWFRTGDLGKQDEDGFIFLVGRIKEQINRGGEKVSPVEIDQGIMTSPDVLEVCTFGVPSQLFGEEIEAAIVLHPDSKLKSLTDEEIQKALTEYSLSKLIKFKVPRYFHILEEIPRTATGKVQRINVGKTLAAKLKK